MVIYVCAFWLCSPFDALPPPEPVHPPADDLARYPLSTVSSIVILSFVHSHPSYPLLSSPPSPLPLLCVIFTCGPYAHSPVNVLIYDANPSSMQDIHAPPVPQLALHARVRRARARAAVRRAPRVYGARRVGARAVLRCVDVYPYPFYLHEC